MVPPRSFPPVLVTPETQVEAFKRIYAYFFKQVKRRLRHTSRTLLKKTRMNCQCVQCGRKKQPVSGTRLARTHLARPLRVSSPLREWGVGWGGLGGGTDTLRGAENKRASGCKSTRSLFASALKLLVRAVRASLRAGCACTLLQEASESLTSF